MTDDLMAWLGPAADEMTDDQLAAVRATAALIETRWPEDDDADLREAALSAATQVILGDTTAAELGARRAAAARADARAVAESIGGAVALVQTGHPKATSARECGIDRMTLLGALGER